MKKECAGSSRQFSFPGGIGSHCTPETPGSFHEGGELGYSLSHAYGAAFDNPDLIVAVMVGDGEAETGPLATAWHSNKFLNPIHDGAVLPILHLNGYKIANPTILGRINHQQLESLFIGYGYKPYFVEGSDPYPMHQAMAHTLESALTDIRTIQDQARTKGITGLPAWPMIVLRTPKGWTGPKEVDGHKVEDFWRAHQVPFDVHKNPAHLELLEKWMKGYKPEELFDERGKLVSELRELAPVGNRRMSANPITNGGMVRKDLRLPDFRSYGVDVTKPATTRVENTRPLGNFLRDIMTQNTTNFRFFCPDETASNKLDAVYQASPKVWMAEIKPEDADGTNLSPDGRVMEMLSEHTLEGWLEGYLLTGRHGFFASYEAFVHVIDSMFNQHAKWLEKCREVSWRAPVSSLNLLITSIGVAAGSQWFQSSGSRVSRSGYQQESLRYAHLPSSGCQLPVVSGGSLPAKHKLRQCDRFGQTVTSAIPFHGGGHRAFHERNQHLELGQQRSRKRTRRGDRRRG